MSIPSPFAASHQSNDGCVRKMGLDLRSFFGLFSALHCVCFVSSCLLNSVHTFAPNADVDHLACYTGPYLTAVKTSSNKNNHQQQQKLLMVFHARQLWPLGNNFVKAPKWLFTGACLQYLWLVLISITSNGSEAVQTNRGEMQQQQLQQWQWQHSDKDHDSRLKTHKVYTHVWNRLETPRDKSKT